MQLIDRYPQSWKESLIIDQASTEQDTSSFLVVDSAFDPRWYWWLRSPAAASTVWTPLFPGTPGRDDRVLEVSPLLIHYSPGATLPTALLDRSEGLPMLSMIRTSETIDVLGLRLRAWCLIGVDQQRFNLRWADTRRLPAIVSALDEVQHAQFFGPLTAWRYIDRNGQWASLPLPTRSTPPATAVELTDDQFSRLVADSEADETIALLFDKNPTLLSSLRPSERYARVMRGLHLADRFAENSQAGRLQLCHLTLKHPQWTAVADLSEQAEQRNSEEPGFWLRLEDCLDGVDT